MSVMKFWKQLMLSLAAVSFLAGSVSADDCEGGACAVYERELNERDWDALYDYVNTKRTINVEEKECNLTLAGDVRFQWRRTDEIDDGVWLYSEEARENAIENAKDFNGHNKFNVAFNLYFDYVCDRGWAVAQLTFDNKAGIKSRHRWFKTTEFVTIPALDKIPDTSSIVNVQKKNALVDGDAMQGSGGSCDISLKKAYVGYNLCTNGKTRVDLEVGRRRLYNVLDSEVQFLSQCDGILLKSDCGSYPWFAKMYARGLVFVVDYETNHFAWAFETGCTNISDTGFDLKYSFIDWRKNGKNRAGERNPTGSKFMISQITGKYHFDQDLLCYPSKLFGAYVLNHDGHRKGDNGVNNNFAWYIGFEIGDVVYAGDWAYKIQYQYVLPFAVPDDDSSGIGNGNAACHSLTRDGTGNTNFAGWRVDVLYALTDSWTLDIRAERSHNIRAEIDDKKHTNAYKQLSLETIYAF